MSVELQSILEITRRALFQMSASSMLVKDIAMPLSGGDPVVELWPEWKRALQVLDRLAEEEFAIGVEMKTLFEVTDRLMATPAQSAAGVLVKLQLLFEISHLECGGSTEFPFPHLNRIIRDIERLV